MPKRPCTNRAEWRVVRGQAPKRLSPHYRLECDYGTSLTSIYKEGDAVFLCEEHSTALSQSDGGPIAGVRVMSSQSPTPLSSQMSFSIEDCPPPATLGRRPLANEEVQIGENAQSAEVAAQTEITRRPAAIKVRDDAKAAAIRVSRREVIFGDSAKALVDEAIWNLEPGNLAAYRTALEQGKTAIEAAEAAGGQLAILHRRITDYAAKVAVLLSESKAILKASELVDCPLEKVMLGIIENSALGEAEKDATIGQLGDFQKWISSEHGQELSPLEAYQLAISVGDKANWGIGAYASEELKSAYRVVYKSLRSAVLSEVPAVSDIDKRLVNLYAAKCSLEAELSQKLCSVAT